MRVIEFCVSNDHPVAGPGWVYAWIHDRRILYVGATWLHPAARAERHLHAETHDPRSLALREVVSGLDSPPSIVATPVPPDLDRQAMKWSLIRESTDRGWLHADFIGPGPESAHGPANDDWLAGAIAALGDHVG